MANLYSKDNTIQIENNVHNPQTITREIKVKVNTFGKIIWYLSFIFIIPFFLHIKWVNYFKTKQMQISNNASLIDIQLTKRAKTIIKLVDALSSHMKFEKDVMSQIAQYRSNIEKIKSLSKDTSHNTSSDAMETRIEIEEQSAPLLTRFMAQFEAYPELKSVELIKDLNNQIVECENNIASARRLYNANASKFNEEILSYPMSVVASSMKLNTILLFSANSNDREDVNLKSKI
ncbi:LemA family protein [Mycoplasmopsis caviae]|uniref:LemA family n=1 Tax=Mycoplasmopsis caviae TaxID=55603 RepID=A0A3P8KAC5_9BACT|nr:LemA family protein [Mycoplasmopsis caviae]UUD34827.1 LemA family protein [Mycoplasmopsis caviae]VDR42319.1 LemA family [Mycoplasmopsis caviae]